MESLPSLANYVTDIVQPEFCQYSLWNMKRAAVQMFIGFVVVLPVRMFGMDLSVSCYCWAGE